MRTHLFTTSPRFSSGSVTLSPEAAGRAADARRMAGTPLGSSLSPVSPHPAASAGSVARRRRGDGDGVSLAA